MILPQKDSYFESSVFLWFISKKRLSAGQFCHPEIGLKKVFVSKTATAEINLLTVEVDLLKTKVLANCITQLSEISRSAKDFSRLCCGQSLFPVFMIVTGSYL